VSKSAPARRATHDAIDFAIAELGITSFADLDAGATYGEHALYAMDSPTVRAGALADARIGRPRQQLLDAIDHAAGRPGLRVVDGDAFDPTTIAEIGDVDAVFLFDVLLSAVAPDWDRVLEIYAPRTTHFVIGNPQWREGDAAIRLIDLGRDRYLDAVPDTASNRELFDHLDDWSPREQRPQRDSRTVWQWGITDAALKGRLEGLGFGLEFERAHGPVPGADAFERKTFVFGRRGRTGDLQRRVDELERALEDVVGSASWRLTKPLRSLKRPFRRDR
jgi:hypothetical protein